MDKAINFVVHVFLLHLLIYTEHIEYTYLLHVHVARYINNVKFVSPNKN